jgi:predicted transposase/invertase (TIGR01784 family)
MPSKAPLPITIGRYIDPLSDFGFKLLFGSDPNKEILIAFLNELFKGRKCITDLTYNKNEYQGPQNDYRKSIYDLTCTGQDGEQFIIEVQKMHQRFFKDRALFYTAALIHDQAHKGNKEWDYELKEVYLIGIMDFVFDDSPPETWLHRIHLADEVTGRPFYDKLGYIFIEIPRFTKTETALETDLDRWLYVLKNMSLLEKIPVILTKRIFEKLFSIAEVSRLTKEEYMQYLKSQMAEWDEYAIRKTIEEQRRKGEEEAREKGLKEGLKDGMRRGIAQGIAQGVEQGIEQGIEKAKEEFVENLITKMNLTDEQVADIAAVPVAFVREIRNTMQ